MLILLSFCCGVKIVHTVEVHYCVKFTCTQSILSGSSDKIRRKHGLQPELLKGQISHTEITKYN